ncbi:MAG: hypothetical protein KDJ16_12475 [Hyphomicrobiales bacterium]|nr:hypothetical protein [Hyphomicrobiales bacterium]
MKLIDQLSQPMGQATGSVEKFDKAIGAAKDKSKDLFADSGVAFDAYKNKLEAINDSLAKMGQVQMGLRETQRSLEALGKPLDDMTNKAVEFEKRIESIARAGGRLDLKGKIGADILDVSKRTNVPWQEIAKGERHLVELGGGEFLDKVSPVRERLNRLAYASEAGTETLYGLFERYINPKIGRMSPSRAMSALEINFGQGKKGSYELKDLAKGLPELLGIGTDFGLSGYQAATNLPAVLQILRQLTGSAREADTRLRHGMSKLTSPGEAKRIKDELGLDVFELRRQAVSEGRDPLLAVANAISDRLTASGAGTVDEKSGTIVGAADPEKLGAIARDFYFRSFLSAFTKMRENLAEFTPAPDEARKQVDADFASRAATAAGSLERLAIAADQNAISLGSKQLDTVKSRADRKSRLYETANGIADAFPGLTSAAVSAWGFGTHAVSTLAGIGASMYGAGMLWKGAQAFGAKYPKIGAIGENVLGAGKGVVKAPWDFAKGFGEGVAAESPAAAAIGRGILQTAGKGLIVGALTAAGEYGVHKVTEALPHAGRNAEVERFANLSLFGKIGDMLSGLMNAAVPAARAETMAPQAPPAAQPQVETNAIDQAKEKATAAGEEIKAALTVSGRAEVDTTPLDAAIAKARELSGLLANLSAQARSAASSLARGSGALHDGFETR